MNYFWYLILLVCAFAFAGAVWSAMKAEAAQREASRKALQRSIDDRRRS